MPQSLAGLETMSKSLGAGLGCTPGSPMDLAERPHFG